MKCNWCALRLPRIIVPTGTEFIAMGSENTPAAPAVVVPRAGCVPQVDPEVMEAPLAEVVEVQVEVAQAMEAPRAGIPSMDALKWK
ncbi:hypothetical protein [Fodinibius salicampi]|uniref:hypothetical protein n=1 Tax=Fodinibius salicampi TaxID=1920655 RepID=UPI00224826A2|nr:hypothetical protein [Fodinibius salicampi]